MTGDTRVLQVPKSTAEAKLAVADDIIVQLASTGQLDALKDNEALKVVEDLELKKDGR